LSDIIKGDNKFVDYFEAIKRCGNHIFYKNPFNLIFDSTNYSDDLLKMKYIRDYLAHRSSESKNRYINKVLNAFGIQAFVIPGDFLIKKRRLKNESYYTKFCNEIAEIDDILNNDILLKGI
jgi:predicted Zn-dependent protease